MLDQVDEEGFRPPSKRVAGAHVHHDEVVRLDDARVAEAFRHPGVGPPIERHLDRVPIRARVFLHPSRDGLKQVPLIHHRVSRTMFAGAVDDACVHPTSPLNVVADPLGRRAGPREPRAPGSTVQIDREVVSRLP